jgi:hypothetical protein
LPNDFFKGCTSLSVIFISTFNSINENDLNNAFLEFALDNSTLIGGDIQLLGSISNFFDSVAILELQNNKLWSVQN